MRQALTGGNYIEGAAYNYKCDVQVITSFGCLAHDPVIQSNFTGKFREKEIRPGKSGDTVNRGTVNRGFTVYISIFVYPVVDTTFRSLILLIFLHCSRVL